jgi:glycine/D-amino acid oxidase-like deaminating enzyme
VRNQREVFSRSHTNNQVAGAQFGYDANGNMTWLLADDLEQSALWNAQNRMAAYMLGQPETWTVPETMPVIDERYGYDANGYRLFRIPDRGNGIPVISLRDGAGQLSAEYTDDPTSGGLVRGKDFIYGAGQLLIERNVEQFLADGGLESLTPAWQSYTAGGTLTHESIVVRTGQKSVALERTNGTDELDVEQFKSGLEPGETYLLEFYA